MSAMVSTSAARSASTASPSATRREKSTEETWTRRERERLERKDAKAADKEKGGAETPEPPTSDDPAAPSGATPIPTPRFVSEAYFMDFKFEPGNYYLAGRELLEGHQVLRIEYYPKRMFNDSEEDQNKDKDKAGADAKNDGDRERNREQQDRERNRERQDRERNRERELEERIERQMNKTALVTLWVDPAEHQIVKYTFDNVWMDFLPAGWLVKVDDIRASMTMGQPFPGIWLPREMNIHAGVTMAMGSLEAAYARRFSDYKQADVKTLIRIPKAPKVPPPAEEPIQPERESGPFVPEHDADRHRGGPQEEVIAEIRIHGNAYVRDEEVIKLAGIAVGQPLPADGLRTIEQRLKASGYFETVEIRKRYRSLESTSDVALVLLVHERPGFTSETIDERPATWGWTRVKSRLMFLPILGYDDGYGFTYGGRVSTIDLLGAGERLSVPLTWGGTRRAALEFERTFSSGPLTRVASTFGIWQQENPHFEVDDQRVEWTARAERSFASLVRAGVDTSQSTVSFGQTDDRLWTIGANVALDTRGDPAFPRNAVMLAAGWTGLHVRSLDQPIIPVHDRCARLCRRHPSGRARRPGAVLRGRPHASRLRTAAARRRLEPARLSRRHVRRRSHAGHLSRAARADHLGAERRKARPDGVHGCRKSFQCGTVAEGCRLAPGCWRWSVPDRNDREAQLRRRPRTERRRHAVCF